MNEELWISEGETRIFEKNKHLIWITQRNIEDIEIPEGYYPIKRDTVIIKNKTYERVYFKNNVLVEAELYKNKKTKEISYKFAGKILQKTITRK